MDKSRSNDAAKSPSSQKQRAGKSSAKPCGAGTALDAQLGEQLRALYDDVLTQPIPDRFLELLNKLDANRT